MCPHSTIYIYPHATVCVFIVLYLCHHTTICDSVYYLCVLILPYMCPHTTIYVSLYYYTCVLILLVQVDVSPYLYMCHTTMCIYSSSYYYICVLTLLYRKREMYRLARCMSICPHTTMCVFILLYMCPHTTIYPIYLYIYYINIKLL